MTAKDQPETTTKPDKQIPGTILSMKLHYNIQEFFQIKWLNAGFRRITVIFRYNCLLHLEHSCLLLLWDMSLPKEQSIFAWCFITPFSFTEILLENAAGSSFFYPFSGHYLCKKVGQNFLKCCKSNTTLPFVPYAKIKLICVVLKGDTYSHLNFECCCFLTSLILSLSLPHFGLILGIY